MNRSFHKAKAVLFDFGGTLDADGIAWKDQFYPLYVWAGVHWTYPEFEKHFYASDDALTGKLRRLSYRKTIERQVRGVLRAGKVRDPGIRRDVVGQYLAQTRAHVRAISPLLARLSRRYRLGVVSNFYGNLPTVLRDLGIARFFRVVIDSERCGHKKPDARIFRLALRTLGVAPEEAVFVGDSSRRDMRGAKQIGMAHVWLVHPGRPVPPPCCKGDLVIRGLSELTKVLL